MHVDFVTILIGHNAWAIDVLLTDAAKLPDRDFRQPFEIGPGSIHDTLLHIIAAMRYWADCIGDGPIRPWVATGQRVYNVNELRDLLLDADADIRHVAEELDARSGWNETFLFRLENGTTYKLTRAAAMMHVLTHGMHHRAQVLNMRRRLGLNPLGWDLDAVEWECLQTGQIDPHTRA